MAEEIVWTGTSSQVKNFWVYFWCAILCVLVVPIIYAFWAWLVVRNRVFQLTTERLLTTEGVFSRTTNTLELYRVRDIRVQQPFWLRLWGMENIELDTADESDQLIVIDCVPSKLNLSKQIRDLVENCRVKKRVREIEVD